MRLVNCPDKALSLSKVNCSKQHPTPNRVGLVISHGSLSRLVLMYELLKGSGLTWSCSMSSTMRTYTQYTCTSCVVSRNKCECLLNSRNECFTWPFQTAQFHADFW